MIAIIGGSGFIGSRLALRLAQSKTSFQIVDKAPSEFFPDRVIQADISYPLSINFSENPSVLINLAAEHRDDVRPLSLYDQVNVDGAINICELARVNRINKIIFTSSVAVYGFALPGTDESGTIKPFNNYGRTKWEAEQIYTKWQFEDPQNRVLIIIRPTVVFGERNRGNVFNLLKQIASGKFVMIGRGENRKSMAYVENVAAFIQHSLTLKPGIQIYNYIDKPDFTMNLFVSYVNKILGRSQKIRFKAPYFIGLGIGKCCDFISFISGKKLAISSIRVKKFCANSVYETAISKTSFVPPVSLLDAIERTVKYEFIEEHKEETVFFSE